MLQAIQRNRNYYAGALIALIGIGTIAQSSQYGIGSLAAIGPGFFPLVMGVVLVISGVLIAMEQEATSEIEVGHGDFGTAEWRGWFCIVGGVASFILLAKSAGLFPATFACVFISALGDRTTTLRNATVLAGAIAVLGCVVFYYCLHIQLPPLAGWRS